MAAEVSEVEDGYIVTCGRHNLIRGVATGQHAAKIRDQHQLTAHADETCAVPVCARLVDPKRPGPGLCNAHYKRKLRDGTPGTSPIRQTYCDVEDCLGEHCAFGLCNKHYQRLRTHGDLEERLRSWPGPQNPNWRGDDVTYSAVHVRLVAARGRADTHACHCGSGARHWAFTGERAPGERQPFSSNLEDYSPMCVPCHKRYDLAKIAGA